MIVEERVEEGWPKKPNLVDAHTTVGFVVDTETRPAALRAVFRTANILTCLAHGVETSSRAQSMR